MAASDLGDCYRILDVRLGASETEIRRAYKLLANVWHPDRFQHDDDLRRTADEKLRAINDAFGALRAAGFAPPAGAQPRPTGARRANSTSVRSQRGPSLATLLAAARRHSSAERFDEEVVALRQAVAVDPESFEAWHGLAWSYDILHTRLRGEPAAPYAAQLTRLGISAEALRAEANRACYQAVRIGSDRPAATELLRSVVSGWAPSEELRTLCEARVASQPTSARAWENLGFLLYATEPEKMLAANAFRRSLKLNPDNPDVWFRLGLCRRDDDWATLEECVAHLRRLGQSGQASILGSTVTFRSRVRRWFGGK